MKLLDFQVLNYEVLINASKVIDLKTEHSI